MSTQLTKIDNNTQALTTELNNSIDYIKGILTPEQEQDFKNNFLALAQNSYLIEKIPTKEILKTAVTATELGININPTFKECYILPFGTKSGMVASIVISKEGLMQQAFNSGFLLKLDRVWNINGDTKKESDMSFEVLALLKPTSNKFVLENLVGWEVSLTDISNNAIKIPYQKTFVGIDYAKEVTKQLQSPQHSIQTYEHKVARRANGDFFIPRSRRTDTMLKLDEYNDSKEFDGTAEVVEVETETVDLMAENKKQEELPNSAGLIWTCTADDIMFEYKNADADKKVMIQAIMKENEGWREFNNLKMAELHDKLTALQ